MADTSLIVKTAIALAAVEGKTLTPADFEKPSAEALRYFRLAEGCTLLFKEPRKQFGTYVEALMESITSQTPYGQDLSAWDATAIERGIREVVGNADGVYWAAEEAFRAGHQAAFDKSVPALMADPTHRPNLACLWEQYTPSDVVVAVVQAMDA